MKRSNILLVFVAAGTLAAGPAFARQSRNETAPKQIQSSTLMKAQKKLDQEGYKVGHADGKWGRKTTEAVKSFQKNNNLPVTGKLDQQTLADLGIGTPSTTGRSVGKKQSSQSGGNTNNMQGSPYGQGSNMNYGGQGGQAGGGSK